jgi:phage-related protein
MKGVSLTVLHICSTVMREECTLQMKIIDYTTDGGKNVIKEYLSSLPKKECHDGYQIRHKIWQNGQEALDVLDTRQLKGKLWEIKFSNNRIMYVIKDKDSIYFLHACKKQKDKAEIFELEKAIKRAKDSGLSIE